MKHRSIVVCNNVICTYSDDVGCFVGHMLWLGAPVTLYLRCDPDEPIDQLIVKLAFDAIHRDRKHWTYEAIDFACKHFIPYFRFISGSKDDRMYEVLPEYLIPATIEFGIDGVIGMSFQDFWIGKKQSYLFVCGPVGIGFCSLQENGEDIPTFIA